MEGFRLVIKHRLPFYGLFLLGLAVHGAVFYDALAQMSVVPKTASAPPPQSGFGTSIVGPWRSTIVTCDFTIKSVPCLPTANAEFAREQPSQPLPPQQSAAAQLFETQAGASETESAVSAAVSALFEVQKLPKGPSPDDGAVEASNTAPAVNPFQLSEKLDWRIEAADPEGNTQPGAFTSRYQPNNPVGVFASQTLLQAGENASVKFDAGVNVEGKTEDKTSGSIAGKAGIVMAW